MDQQQQLGGQQLRETEIFLTRDEAAAYLRRSRPTLERWAQQGTGPRFRMIGGRALYSIADLRAFAGVPSEAA